MTTLSPAAQAVLDAVALSMEGGWISPDFIPYEAHKAAAALRAAADQLTHRVSILELNMWANELEALS